MVYAGSEAWRTLRERDDMTYPQLLEYLSELSEEERGALLGAILHIVTGGEGFPNLVP